VAGQDDSTRARLVILDDPLVTTLRAAEKFSPSHLAKPEIKEYIDHAKFFYILVETLKTHRSWPVKTTAHAPVLSSSTTW
jgi:hypothetical protein